MTGRNETSGGHRILSISGLFPNNMQPRNGIFVRERLRQLLRRHEFDLTVMAPVPWFPFKNKVFGQYAQIAGVVSEEQQQGLSVWHPRYFMLPKIGDAFSPLTYARCVLALLTRMGRRDFDLVDAHYFFPDGAAAVLVARSLNCPVVITARGSDLNLMPAELLAGRWIRWAARHCDAAAGVSLSLCDRLAEIGVPDARRHYLPNGVDQQTFVIRDAPDFREQLSDGRRIILSVGNLIELKGHHLAIEALQQIENAVLVIIGSGPMRESLESLALRCGVGGRVQFVGEISQAELVKYYNAADVLVLASRSEGMPNVVLESLSCGTPVVATDVGGARDLVRSGQAGRLIRNRSVGALENALVSVLESPADPQEVRKSVADFGWNETCGRIAGLFDRLSGARQLSGSI